MRAATGKAHLGDRIVAAGEAGLAVAVIDAEECQIAAGIAVRIAKPFCVEGRAIMRNATGDYVLNGSRQAGDLRIGEGANRRLWMDTGAVKRFVRIRRFSTGTPAKGGTCRGGGRAIRTRSSSPN
jgi:hypothetical protein